MKNGTSIKYNLCLNSEITSIFFVYLKGLDIYQDRSSNLTILTCKQQFRFSFVKISNRTQFKNKYKKKTDTIRFQKKNHTIKKI